MYVVCCTVNTVRAIMANHGLRLQWLVRCNDFDLDCEVEVLLCCAPGDIVAVVYCIDFFMAFERLYEAVQTSRSGCVREGIFWWFRYSESSVLVARPIKIIKYMTITASRLTSVPVHCACPFSPPFAENSHTTVMELGKHFEKGLGMMKFPLFELDQDLVSWRKNVASWVELIATAAEKGEDKFYETIFHALGGQLYDWGLH